MTVKELIEQLKKFEDEEEVFVDWYSQERKEMILVFANRIRLDKSGDTGNRIIVIEPEDLP